MSNVLIIGGNRSGEYIKWFGNRVAIDGTRHVLHDAHFKDGTKRRYYVKEGLRLESALHTDTLARVEVCG